VTGRVLVTGAAGFIGSHTCRAFLDDGWDVLGVDNFDPFYDRSLKEAALADLVGYPAFQFVEGDIREQSALTRLLDGASVVVHLAARPGVRPSIEDPELYVSLNVQGTVSVLEACRRAGVRRVVFGSSSSVYGDDTPVPFREDAEAATPISPYAATKRSAELHCRVYVHLHRMRIASLRFFTVYGPRQRPDLAIHRFTRLLAAGESVRRYGNGSSERDYTHIDDILLGIKGAAEWTSDPAPAFEIFNLGESRTVSLNRLIELISDALGVSPRIEEVAPQPGDVRRTCADITKARRVLGYRPTVTIEDGISQFAKWYEAKNGRQS
jgi:UDP-glucuronate 4-epimerase